MVGQLLGHYRLLEQIGAGGMGVVYRARDERLERDVALKVLPIGVLADETTRKRFRQEALALSRLNHRNIATIHDFDSQDGTAFLVMELVPGATLDARLDSGPLSEKDVLRLGAQLAHGLAAAHAQGIVHRDLKPANLRLAGDGQLKILDFGVAQLLQPAGESDTTASAAHAPMAGTLAYMSPEQVRGDLVDARSDLYAAGAVLYEMATGQRPHAASHAPLLIDAILNRVPKDPSALNSKVSPGLERAIIKALDKDPGRRYQSATELAVDLERLNAPVGDGDLETATKARRRRLIGAGVLTAAALSALVVGTNVAGLRDRLLGVGPTRIETLAVLPFANTSGDSGQEYFADAMTDALITDLARISSLRVISRTSVMSFKSPTRVLPEIARALNADAIIEGSVLRVGNRVRITAQLIDGATDRRLWGNDYERDVSDVLALQQELARAITTEVRAQLTQQDRERLTGAPQVNGEAYEAYLRGRAERSPTAAAAYYKLAIEKDPRFAPAYAGLASFHFGVSLMAATDAAGRASAIAEMRALAFRAVDLDPRLPEPHLALGDMYRRACNWTAAEREFDRAIELAPGDADAHLRRGGFVRFLGRPSEAASEVAIGRQLDPLSVTANATLTRYLFLNRQYDRAIEQHRRSLELDPNAIHQPAALSHLMSGRFDEGIAGLEADSRRGSRLNFLAYLGYAYGVAGRKAEALQALAEIAALLTLDRPAFLRKYPTEGRFLRPDGRIPLALVASMAATVNSGLGDTARAVDWLERLFPEPSCDASLALRDAFRWSPLHERLQNAPRFQALVKRIGYAP